MTGQDLDFGRYEATVLSAWGAALVLIAALVAVTLWRGARVRRQLEAAEARRAQGGSGEGRA